MLKIKSELFALIKQADIILLNNTTKKEIGFEYQFGVNNKAQKILLIKLINKKTRRSIIEGEQ